MGISFPKLGKARANNVGATAAAEITIEQAQKHEEHVEAAAKVTEASADPSVTPAPVAAPTGDIEKNPAVVDAEEDQKETAEGLQRGVQNVEAVTQVWTKKTLIAMFFNMFMLYFVNALQSTILSSLTPYVTSDFQSHSLLTVIDVVSFGMTASLFIPVAKILDVWGRAEGFVIMAGCATLGLILMATCNNISSFCAAQVFYNVGFTGMTYCIDVVTADSSTLRNRGLAFAFTSSPYMITAFAGPKAAERFVETSNWRWGFGMFAIILPVVAAPMYGMLQYNLRKAKKFGIVLREPSGRTLKQSIWFYAKEFDLMGIILFACGLVTFLLPFNLANSATNGWSSAYIIAMIVVGFVVLIAFGLWEVYLAPVPFLNYKFLTDRTVVGACLLSATYQISYYCWASYFSSFLQVVNDASIARAGYIDNTFNVVSGVLLIMVGFSIRKTGYFKWLWMIGIPLYVFSQGLMIYFRRPNQNIGYLIMCQVLISIAGSVFIICQQLAVLAAVDHQHVAAALALLNVVGTTGGAIGSAISGSIWTNTFESALERYLPEDALQYVADIYGDLYTQLSYEVGTPERIAIQKAYGYAQTRMLAAGTGVMGLSFIWIVFVRNINVGKIKQVHGTVF